ncbi:MAG: glycoside hydrolase family 5 protein, partial [bacterium]|nr:glycoside hydrolase family 5 protein [bacterium]
MKSSSSNRSTQRAKARPRTAGRAAAVALFSSLLLLPPAAEPQGPAFVRRQGRKLVLGDGGPEIHLRGVNFNNHHWEEDPELILDSDHHSEIDFQRIAAMGMNTVRFNLSYRVFEDDDEPFVYRPEGWAWLDRNVAWAKRWGLRLIVDMHVPQGGYQGGTDMGLALWDEEASQDRLKALWRAIALRYRDETAIAAWDPVNEPTPRTLAQWESLAQELVDEIRSVDPNHLLIIEVGYAVLEELPFILVDDENVMYDFHTYSPGQFTQQYDSFNGHGDGGSYPSPDTAVVPWDWVFFAAVETSRVPPGTTDWTLYESAAFLVDDEAVVAATPTFGCERTEGSVEFDDFVINEYTAAGAFNRRVIAVDVELPGDGANTIDPYPSEPQWWLPWSSDGGGTSGLGSGAHLGETSLAISAVTETFALTNGSLTFPVRQGHRYGVRGFMRGLGVTEASCSIVLEFGALPEGEERTPVDRSFLEDDLLTWSEFGAVNNVPINVGEFGLMAWCYEDDRGAVRWLRDMTELMIENGLSFQLYDYHSVDYGLYSNLDGLPDPTAAHQGAIDLMTELLGPPPAPACTRDDTTLCLNQDRFQVRVTWKDFAGNSGPGRVAAPGSDDS